MHCRRRRENFAMVAKMDGDTAPAIGVPNWNQIVGPAILPRASTRVLRPSKSAISRESIEAFEIECTINRTRRNRSHQMIGFGWNALGCVPRAHCFGAVEAPTQATAMEAGADVGLSGRAKKYRRW
jgi:hypothetical protein